MTAKDCGHHVDRRKTLLRRLVIASLVLASSILLTILLIYLILHPQKPHFTLRDVTLLSFNLSSSPPYNYHLLTSAFQITLQSRNPNDRIGIYYDRVDVHAAYRGQPITAAVRLPPSYQGPGGGDAAVWSPYLCGAGVAVAEEIVEDEVVVEFRVEGRVRWRVGEFVSGGYGLNVRCAACVDVGMKDVGGDGGGGGGGVGVKYGLIMDCHVDV